MRGFGGVEHCDGDVADSGRIVKGRDLGRGGMQWGLGVLWGCDFKSLGLACDYG